METLTITQEYFMLTIPKKGKYSINSGDPNLGLGLISACLSDLSFNKIAKIEKKKIYVIAPLPQKFEFLGPIYDRLCQKDGYSITKLVNSYVASFSTKEFRRLEEAIADSIVDNGIEKEAKSITFNSAYKNQIIERIRAELLEDVYTDETVALAALLDKTKQLKQYFSQHEQDQIKNLLVELRASDSYTTLSKMISIVDTSNSAVMMSTILWTMV